MRKITNIVIVLIFFLVSIALAVDNPKNLRVLPPGGVIPTDPPPDVPQPLPYFDQNFQVDRGVSRNSGVAPLSVHFTAGFNASSASDRGFHNYEYTWNFGDPFCSKWGTTGKSKNIAKGPIAAHVYEAPGTYTATLTIRDATGVRDTETFSITVTDPESVYSGSKTTCISDTAHNNFEGCPSGATQVSTDDLSRITNYIDTGRRVLLHRGSSWTSGGITMPSNAGPVSIGAYGPGLAPGTTGIFSNAPSITMTGGVFCDLSSKQDWRIYDLSFSGSLSVPAVFSGAIDMQRILMLRIKTVGFSYSIDWTHWNDYPEDLIDQMAVVECDLSESDEMQIYGGSERLILLGNVAKNSNESHTVRVWQAYQAVISNNDFSGSSIITDSGRHAFKLHGPGYSTFSQDTEYCTPGGSDTCLQNRTQFVIISDNLFGASGPWPISIGPQDIYTDSNLTDIIFERNRYHADYGTQSVALVSIAVGFEAGYSTLRNNIIDGTGAGNDFIGIQIWRRATEPPPVADEVYNNTIYRSDNGQGAMVGIQINSTARQIVVINNVVSFPNSSGSRTLLNNGSPDLVQSNNILLTNSGFVAPINTNPLLRDFSPQANSILDEAGSQAIPLIDDFMGVRRIRDGAYDIGAIEN